MVYVLLGVLQAEADAHKAGYDFGCDAREDLDGQVGNALTGGVDVQQVLDKRMGTKAARAHTDAALCGQQAGDEVVGDVLHFE